MRAHLGLMLMLGSVVLLTGLLQSSSAAAPLADSHSFPETGHTVSGLFWAYWQTHGGLDHKATRSPRSSPRPAPSTAKPITSSTSSAPSSSTIPENAGTPYTNPALAARHVPLQAEVPERRARPTRQHRTTRASSPRLATPWAASSAPIGNRMAVSPNKATPSPMSSPRSPTSTASPTPCSTSSARCSSTPGERGHPLHESSSRNSARSATTTPTWSQLQRRPPPSNPPPPPSPSRASCTTIPSRISRGSGATCSICGLPTAELPILPDRKCCGASSTTSLRSSPISKARRQQTCSQSLQATHGKLDTFKYLHSVGVFGAPIPHPCKGCPNTETKSLVEPVQAQLDLSQPLLIQQSDAPAPNSNLIWSNISYSMGVGNNGQLVLNNSHA